MKFKHPADAMRAKLDGKEISCESCTHPAEGPTVPEEWICPYRRDRPADDFCREFKYLPSLKDLAP